MGLLSRMRRPRGPVHPKEATGTVARIFDDVPKVLRVNGIHLVFRTWAREPVLLETILSALRPSLGTRAFEDAADGVRREAAMRAAGLGRLGAIDEVPLGELERFRLRGLLDLYRYGTPKLAVLISAVRMALAGEPVGRGARGEPVDPLPRGIPRRMPPMEMETEDPSDRRLKRIYDDVVETYDLAEINSLYRSLALFPDYLEVAWARLKPHVGGEAYEGAADRVREAAREAARDLPHEVLLSPAQLSQAGVDVERVVEEIRKFDAVIPLVVVNAMLLSLDFRGPEDLAGSPFPPDEATVVQPDEGHGSEVHS